MTQEKRPQSSSNTERLVTNREAGCLYAVITDKRPVSRRNRASWYLRQLNKLVQCDEDEPFDNEVPAVISEPDEESKEATETPSPVHQDVKDINLVAITDASDIPETKKDLNLDDKQQQFLVTTNTRVTFLSKSIATSIILDLSPSVVSVSSHNGCVFLDSILDALKRVLHLLVKEHEIPCPPVAETHVISPKVFVSVIAYTPFVVAKNNQVLVQNRRICFANIDQVLVEIWICLNRITQEIQELVSNTCGITLSFDMSKPSNNVFVFPQQVSAGIIRHPGSVLEDIYELGIFSSSLMPRRSRLSVIIITDGLFASSNNLNMFRLKSIALSFISLCTEDVYPDGCFGYTPYIDLMKFAAKTTQGIYLTHRDLLNSSQQLSRLKQIPLIRNPLHKLFSWALHSEVIEDHFCNTPQATSRQNYNPTTGEGIDVDPNHLSRFFCIDQAGDHTGRASKSFDFSKRAITQCYHDWRSFRQLDRNLDADFEQVLSCLLREGYLIKNIQFKHKENTRIVARLVLHWKHNLDVEQELTAPYWSNTDLFDMGNSNHQLMLRPFNTTLYGDTYCEIFIHGSYSFLHNLYCDKRTKRRSEYREIAYKQYRQLIDGILQTHDRLQYLSRFYRDSSLSRVPSFLLHGNSLLYEQPHTHRLTSTIENVMDESKTSEFQEYWQKISCLDTKSWKNLMHIHTLRLVLEHDQPKHKNIHYQNANGRYTHVQCRRALSAISNFIKSYASFALLEDSTYIKFIYNKDDDLREIETSATKGFIVIRINKLLPIIVIHLMFTSGILDSHRIQIVSYLEEQLTNYKLRNVRTSTVQVDSILKSKTISPSSESCCVLIRSPLERMLKVYSRNFINDYLMHNWAHGLPGSCPYSMQQSRVANNQAANNNTNQSGGANTTTSNHNNNTGNTGDTKASKADSKDNVENYQADDSINRYNLIFSKYLYGVRTIHTLSELPNEIIPSLAANVLSKISAILVNFRIKQGFHIAFSNSGILNLVVELDMKDRSSNDEISSCLCQYIVFPPTVVNSANQAMHAVLNSGPNGCTGLSTANSATVGSKPASMNDSESSFIKSHHTDLTQMQAHKLRNDCGEIKVIQEYWIEQQYGLSTSSDSYHQSLENMRYSEIVDHLFITDSSIFECLLTYDLLQLLCDKLSNYYDLDISLINNVSGSATKSNSMMSPTLSPTLGSCSVNPLGSNLTALNGSSNLPSNLIEFNTRGGNSKIPLLELNYKFSVTKFLDYCQLASLNVLLFRDTSDFFEADKHEERLACQNKTNKQQDNHHNRHSHHHASPPMRASRKMSMDIRDSDHHDMDHVKREHRSSYQHDHLRGGSANTYVNPLCSISLNHMFLDTLHKRLKQMHDKELRLSEYDRKRLPLYLRRRAKLCGQAMMMEMSNEPPVVQPSPASPLFKARLDTSSDEEKDEEETCASVKVGAEDDDDNQIDWRCFLRKGNQENLMIVLVPASLADVSKWLSFAHHAGRGSKNYDPVCPVFVFRCSSSMINDHVLSFLDKDNDVIRTRLSLEADLELHFGQPCRYMDQLKVSNDELVAEVLPLIRHGTTVIQSSSDEKTLEAMHFRAFLRKIKNTVLKSRFSSLNEAYLSELFVHRDDILYYMNNVDTDTQKKYHVSSHLRSLSDFIKSYQDYSDSLPKEPQKACNPLLNSILLQKCGLFINQPIARFNEANPLIRQLHDKKLLFLMRCNFKVELPILEENLAGSSLLRDYLTSSNHSRTDTLIGQRHTQRVSPVASSSLALSSPITKASAANQPMSQLTSTTSSLGKNESLASNRLLEMKCGSVGAPGPLQHHHTSGHHSNRPSLASQLPPRMSGSSSALSSSALGSSNDSLILEAFRRNKSCPIKELHPSSLVVDVNLRHEAHMAQVLRRSSERKESHQYRRVLKSKQNYSQSHGAIDQALKRVDSLGRLEHFCLTPLLFSPDWRSRLAPVRDHTIESHRSSRDQGENYNPLDLADTSANLASEDTDLAASDFSLAQTIQQEADERWHQMVCNNYIKEYEQYIQTLGFNSVQIRYQSSSGQATTNKSTAPTNSSTPSSSAHMNGSPADSNLSMANSRRASKTKHQRTSVYLRKGPLSGSSSSLQPGSQSTSQQQAGTYNTGYLIKFLNRGCLVFKVGFCKPYVYSILYSIEGERFNNTNLKMNMTNFLDELDNIKVTMHLHSFTYDYHLRSMYSYIAGRQLTFNPGYHLISFLDDFRKYYQKAPNYARNHILCGEIQITDIKVSGQQLYNYIVTHNSIYNMEVLEMISSSLVASQHSSASSAGRLVIGANSSTKTYLLDNQGLIIPTSDQQALMSTSQSTGDQQNTAASRSHANDYVLIELKREKVFYQDGKDPDVFDCGLLITHDFIHDENSPTPNCLTLKYFLLLTNQRDLYPKLVHETHDNDIISLGCHRPIRLGLSQLNRTSQRGTSSHGQLASAVGQLAAAGGPAIKQQQEQHKISSSTMAPSTNLSDCATTETDGHSELQSSGELSGPQSIISTTNSIQSSSSGHQLASYTAGQQLLDSSSSRAPTEPTSQDELPKPASSSPVPSSVSSPSLSRRAIKQQPVSGNNSDSTGAEGAVVASTAAKSAATPANNKLQERTICDEEITYLGYFSSDEMDMLKFLQEKRDNLRRHIEEVVKLAEVHYRRDYLWHRLMQRTSASGTKLDEMPLSLDELLQLLNIVDSIELASLDPQLSMFTSMHLSWHMKLVKAFGELRQSSINQHRIYTAKVTSSQRLLLLYIDPKCTTAFILLAIDPDRGSTSMSLLLKDKQECQIVAADATNKAAATATSAASSSSGAGGIPQPAPPSAPQATSGAIELDQDCQQLINDFINFCATFMWSSFLT